MKLAFYMGLIAMASLLPVSASAQVYELGDGGALRLRDGTGAVTWTDPNAPAPAPSEALSGDAVTQIASVAAPINYAEMLIQTAARHSLSPALLDAVVWQESRWNAGALSPKGAMGLTQLMPATAAAMGANPRDPASNLDGGARYLRLMLNRFEGNLEKALAAYNAGPNRVERAGGIPAIAETQNYVASILARLGRVTGRP